MGFGAVIGGIIGCIATGMEVAKSVSEKIGARKTAAVIQEKLTNMDRKTKNAVNKVVSITASANNKAVALKEIMAMPNGIRAASLIAGARAAIKERAQKRFL